MASDRDLTMVLVGDVFVRREDPPSMFRHVGAVLRGADFTLGNLEGPVADSGVPMPARSDPRLINLKSNARNIAAIEAAGFDAMGVTNNHSLDFGYEALFETRAHLDRIGVRHTGAGRSKAEAHAPAIVECHGCRVALLAYDSVFMPGWEAGEDKPGIAVIRARTAYEPSPRFNEQPGSPPIVRSWAWPEDKDRLAADIAAARRQADLVVCSFHWGVSWHYVKLAEYQVEVGHHAVDAGADLVFGHHPHVLQGVEVYRGRAIFYSLGNFAFDLDMPDNFEREAGIVRCRIRDQRITGVEFLPTCSDDTLTPRLLDLDRGRPVLAILDERSKEFGTQFRPAGDAVAVVAG